MAMKSLFRTGESAVVLAMMFAGALALWIGVPLLWLYIGSVVQESTGSVGAALGLMLVGSVATILLLVPLLGRLNEAYEHLREHRGLDNYGQAPLEAMLVISAVVAVAMLVVYFFVFGDGGAPLPIPDGEG
jgi:nitric oxide reductase large subunit